MLDVAGRSAASRAAICEKYWEEDTERPGADVFSFE